MRKKRSRRQRLPNHLREIQWLAQLGILRFTPGTVQEVTIEHDNWCAVWHGGRCNCDPLVQLPRVPGDARNN